MYNYPEYDVTHEICKQIKNAYNQVCRINTQIEERTTNLSGQRTIIEGQVDAEVKQFLVDINAVKTTIESFKEKFGAKQVKDYNIQIGEIGVQLKELAERKLVINAKQKDLERDETPFETLDQCSTILEPFKNFWGSFEELSKAEEYWNETPINELEADDIQSHFKKLKAVMQNCEARFDGMKLRKLSQLAKSKKEGLLKFQKKIPVIRALTTKGLKEVHISKMAKELNHTEKTDITKLPLSSMPDAETHIQFLEAEADFANRQYTMFNNMNDMKAAWVPLNFDTVEWKGVSYILTGDAVEQL